ncbi:hypothetical protein [Nocardia sp. NPDC004604]
MTAVRDLAHLDIGRLGRPEISQRRGDLDARFPGLSDLVLTRS